MARYSFIIPACNAAKTIRAAVGSILANVPEAEVIIVENGSADDTYAAAEKLAENCGNILLLRSEKGVSEARNTGIRHASGKWILFVDADDLWLGSRACLDFLTSAERDLIVCSYRKGNGFVIHDFRQGEAAGAVPEEQQTAGIKAWMLSAPTLRMTVWAKIFRREFLLENDLYFNTSLRYSEDSEFLVRCLKACRTAAVSKKVIYEYRIAEGSAMRSADSARIKGYLSALELVRKELPHDSAYRSFVAAHVNLIAVHDIFDCTVHSSWRERIRRMKKLMERQVIKEEAKQIPFPCSLQLVPSFLFIHGLYTPGGVICFLRSARNRSYYGKCLKERKHRKREKN